jgi:hypothetical protein
MDAKQINVIQQRLSMESEKLIGSPGYIGHRETPAILNQAAIDQSHTKFPETLIPRSLLATT